MADDKFHVTALVLPVIGVSIFTILPIVFMILMAFTDFGGDIVHPRLASWSLSAWTKILGVGSIGDTFGRILTWNILWAVLSTSINFFGGLALALLLNKRNVRGSKLWRAFPILAYAIRALSPCWGSSSCSRRAGRSTSCSSRTGTTPISFCPTWSRPSGGRAASGCL